MSLILDALNKSRASDHSELSVTSDDKHQPHALDKSMPNSNDADSVAVPRVRADEHITKEHITKEHITEEYSAETNIAQSNYSLGRQPIVSQGVQTRQTAMFLLVIALLSVIVVLLFFIILREPNTTVRESGVPEPLASEPQLKATAPVEVSGSNTLLETSGPATQTVVVKTFEPVMADTPEPVLLKETPKPSALDRQSLSPEIGALYQKAAQHIGSSDRIDASGRKQAVSQQANNADLSDGLGSEQLALARSIAKEWESPDLSTQAKQDEFVANMVNNVRKETSASVPSTSIVSYSDVPYLHELDTRVQVQIPSINYSSHVYSEKSGAVVLNQVTLKSRGNLGNGVVVESILSDGIILSFNNDLQFKLTALSSWVNVQ